MKKAKKGKHNTPLISILMPVHNAGNFLMGSLESIRKQTYKHFELIIINDGSTDHTHGVLKKYRKKDKRFKIHTYKIKVGFPMALKRAFSKAKGAYYARMDADDIAAPDRLEKQFAYLSQNSRVVAVGGQSKVIDEEGRTIGTKTFPLNAEAFYSYLFSLIQIHFPPLMINQKNLPKNFYLNQSTLRMYPEPELFFRLLKYGPVENLPNIVSYYRLHNKNASLKDLKKTARSILFSRLKGVLEHEYKPTVGGMITTLIQALFIILLPQKTIFWLYKKSKQIKPVKRRDFLKFKFAGKVTYRGV